MLWQYARNLTCASCSATTGSRPDSEGHEPTARGDAGRRPRRRARRRGGPDPRRPRGRRRADRAPGRRRCSAGPETPRGDPARALTWHAGKRTVELADHDPALAELLAGVDVVLDTPGWPGTVDLDPGMAPGAVWVRVTPFGLDGPRAGWTASDLGVMASSGNMWCTGDPDRAPLRCAEPTAYAHTAPEAALAALTALASGRPQVVDLSMQETVLVANMGGPGRWFRDHDRGRRRGARIGRTREIWPCADGWVSFGIRGGKARVGTWATMTRLIDEDGLDTAALEDRDWEAFSHNTADDDELTAISETLAAYFARHTMTELYELACEHHLTLAPVNSPREIHASAQLAARDFFGPLEGAPAQLGDRFPRRFARVRQRSGALEPIGPRHAERPTTVASLDTTRSRSRPEVQRTGGGAGAWAGTRIVELGSGAAGPIATRYFAEHGATVVRVESRKRPDFLRVYALGPNNPHGLDGAPMFDALNVGKLSVSLDLKQEAGRELALRLVDRADAVSENFAPKAMAGLGLDYDSLAARKPGLVMVSACLNGQTGPHRDYPGFGGQGAALAGFNHLTGWPDREPVGPFGTITDSLAPRFVATAIAAGLLHRDRTGEGVHVDLSQVEAGTWSLSPWLVRYALEGEITDRMGNRSPRTAPHGAFPCAGDDRWVTIAVWSDEEWERLTSIVGIDDPGLATREARLARVDEVEKLIAEWTRSRDRFEVATRLQEAGIEAVPVQDFEDVHGDPQLAHRNHFVRLSHPNLGPGDYELDGFRLSDAPASHDRPSPLLGEHTDHVLGDLLGVDPAELTRLREAGVLD
ncbi:MAG: CoA transferase [Acidimicrobiia bacterium]|nr:CoA transferase [Acidimicrobiia bacterium]